MRIFDSASDGPTIVKSIDDTELEVTSALQ
jgi:hypothetical protein